VLRYDHSPEAVARLFRDSKLQLMAKFMHGAMLIAQVVNSLDVVTNDWLEGSAAPRTVCDESLIRNIKHGVWTTILLVPGRVRLDVSKRQAPRHYHKAMFEPQTNHDNSQASLPRLREGITEVGATRQSRRVIHFLRYLMLSRAALGLSLNSSVTIPVA